jgi:hypothetical protein
VKQFGARDSRDIKRLFGVIREQSAQIESPLFRRD